MITMARRKISIVRWVISFLVLVPLVFIWAMFLSKHWTNYEVISASMSPTLQVGDRVIMKEEKHFDNLRDEIIAFKDPGGEDTALTKRVVADQNSTVRMWNGQVFIDNSKDPLPGEHIDNVPNHLWDVGAGEVFVMGDNRNNSHDSVDFGPIQRSSILGVLTFRYWPWSRSGRLSR